MPSVFPHQSHNFRQRGVSAIETVLLLAVIGIPLMLMVFMGIKILANHFGMFSTLNSLPIF